ncbi:hypothetical protein GH714_039863 [Hevea brasiliensis]|uniref:BURP domain-containing protein n=1 Tax=Hevea brasiliensis TaxID=3981 RepID=A0A6A6KEX8_HEVBR|nr:hypothetical protein GH714_039863 [Hevea brasiliensis]
MGDKYTYWDMGFNADETLVPSDDRRIKYGKRYEQAFAEDTNDRREKYGKRYEQAFAEDTSDRREKYGKRYEQAFAEDTNDRREKYGKRYEQAFTEDTTTDRREKYGKRYEQAFAEDTSDRREKYGKRYEQAFAEDTSDRREKYGKRYEQAFAEDTSDRREKYGKRYEQAFAEDTTDRREKYGKRYERKFNKHALPNSTVFFLPNDLHVGKRMRLHITKSSNKARILPQQVADTLPFSTNNLAEILKRFSVKPESRQGKMIKQTVEDCESPAIKGEDRYCPRSLESLVDFGVKHVGNKAQVLMNEVDKPTREQEYTIMGVKFIGENHVVCHKQKYPYAVIIAMHSKALRNLSVLDLGNNNLHGSIPATFVEGNSLSRLDLNGNQLEGPLPRSLFNCSKLVTLNLGNNRINGSFPYWLENLAELRVLVLLCNRFSGPIPTSKARFPFPRLLVIELSHNDFTGPLPARYFQQFQAMMKENTSEYYEVHMTITIKGDDFEVTKVLDIFAMIDLSNNQFRGEISENIGELELLKGLNFSHNHLSGHTPVGNLSNLE